MSARELAPESAAADSEQAPSGAPWRIGLIVGATIFAIGLVGLAQNARQTRPGNWLEYVVGALIAHDALLAPAVLAGGFLLTRLVPAAIRGGLQATLAVCGAVALISIPVLKAAGRQPDNPSLLPHHYGTNLAIVLALVFAAGMLLTLGRAARARRTSGR